MDLSLSNVGVVNQSDGKILTIVEGNQDVTFFEPDNSGRFRVLSDKNIPLGQYTGLDDKGGLIDFIITGREGNLYTCILTDFATAEDRRMFKRFRYVNPTQFVCEAKKYLVISEDVSIGGMCFKCMQSVNKGVSGSIKVVERDLWVPGKVAWSREVRGGYRHGVEFMLDDSLTKDITNFILTLS